MLTNNVIVTTPSMELASLVKILWYMFSTIKENAYRKLVMNLITQLLKTNVLIDITKAMEDVSR